MCGSDLHTTFDASELGLLSLLHVHVAVGRIIRTGEESLDSHIDLGVGGGGVADGEAAGEQAQQFVNDELKVWLRLFGRLGSGDECDERHEVGFVAQILRQVENHALNDSETFLYALMRLKSVHEN